MSTNWVTPDPTHLSLSVRAWLVSGTNKTTSTSDMIDRPARKMLVSRYGYLSTRITFSYSVRKIKDRTTNCEIEGRVGTNRTIHIRLAENMLSGAPGWP